MFFFQSLFFYFLLLSLFFSSIFDLLFCDHRSPTVSYKIMYISLNLLTVNVIFEPLHLHTFKKICLRDENDLVCKCVLDLIISVEKKPPLIHPLKGTCHTANKKGK